MKVIIVGAGITGLAHAIALSARGDEVVVLEKAPEPRQGGYMVDFFGRGWGAADRLGVLDAIKRLGRNYSTLRQVDQRGRKISDVPLKVIAAGLGGEFVSIMRSEIEEALRDKAETVAELRYGVAIAEISTTATEVDVRLATGEQLTADLLLGADGLHSQVRRDLWGPEDSYVRSLGYAVAAYTIEVPEVATALADTVEIADRVGVQTMTYAMDAGDSARYGRYENKVAVLVVASANETPRDGWAWATDRVRGTSPRADLLLANQPDDLYTDAVAQSIVDSWRRGRALLVGDAAHAVSIVAGQGASLGIASADALAAALGDADVDELDSRLAAFEATWRPIVERHQSSGRRMAGGFIPKSRWGLFKRHLGFRALALPGAAALIRRSGALTH